MKKTFLVGAAILVVVLAAIYGILLYQRVQDKDQEFRDSRATIESQLKEIDDLKANRTQLEKDVQVLRETLQHRASELEEARKTAAMRVGELEKSKKDEGEAVDRLQESLTKTQRQNTKIEEEQRLCKESANELGRKLREEEAQGISCQEEVKGLRQELAATRKQSEGTEAAVRDLESTYKDLASRLKSEIERKEVLIDRLEKTLSVSIVDRILFKFGKVSITPQGHDILQKVGKIVKEAKGCGIRVIGHTDNVPIAWSYRYRFPSNWELSAARAATVVNYFQNQVGIDPRRMQATGRSAYAPVASNNTPEGRALNRRVAIILGPPLDGDRLDACPYITG